MIVIAVVAAKGGVGKSTIAANLSVGLSRRGRTVLAVDLDPQNALHLHLGGKPEDIAGLSRASVGGSLWSDVCVLARSGVSVLPFGRVDDANLLALEHQIAGDAHWLSHNLRRLELPDDAVVILDTPPGASNYLRQALDTADLVISVMLADAASYATLPQIEQLIRRHHGSRYGQTDSVCIINQADDARPLSTESAELIQRVLGERVIGVVHADSCVSDALAGGHTVVESSTDSIGREDLLYCVDWVQWRLEASPGASPGAIRATRRVYATSDDIPIKDVSHGFAAQPEIRPRHASREPSPHTFTVVLGEDDRRRNAPLTRTRWIIKYRPMTLLLLASFVLFALLAVLRVSTR